MGSANEILDRVAASMELEGSEMSPEIRELARRAVVGEITFDEARAVLAQKFQPLSIA